MRAFSLELERRHPHDKTPEKGAQNCEQYYSVFCPHDVWESSFIQDLLASRDLYQKVGALQDCTLQDLDLEEIGGNGSWNLANDSRH